MSRLTDSEWDETRLEEKRKWGKRDAELMALVALPGRRSVPGLLLLVLRANLYILTCTVSNYSLGLVGYLS